MKILVVDGCVRKESRTKSITDVFISEVKKINSNADIEILNLQDMNLQYLNGEMIEKRNALVANGKLDDEMLDLAHKFANADKIVISAPMYDLGLPAIVKVFIENISVEKVTFYSDETGLHGLCKANELLYITSRGGIYENSDMDIASKYLSALCQFYNIGSMNTIFADGLDIAGFDVEGIVKAAKQEAVSLAAMWKE